MVLYKRYSYARFRILQTVTLRREQSLVSSDLVEVGGYLPDLQKPSLPEESFVEATCLETILADAMARVPTQGLDRLLQAAQVTE